jgi:hypothetical protein
MERTRQCVAKAMRRAQERIEVFHPALGRHLRAALSIGTFSMYRPNPVVPWTVTIDPSQ